MSQNDRDYAEKRDYIRMRVDADITLLYAGQIIRQCASTCQARACR